MIYSMNARWPGATEWPYMPCHVVDGNGLPHDEPFVMTNTETGECALFVRDEKGEFVFTQDHEDIAVRFVKLKPPLTYRPGRWNADTPTVIERLK